MELAGCGVWIHNGMNCGRIANISGQTRRESCIVATEIESNVWKKLSYVITLDCLASYYDSSRWIPCGLKLCSTCWWSGVHLVWLKGKCPRLSGKASFSSGEGTILCVCFVHFWNSSTYSSYVALCFWMDRILCRFLEPWVLARWIQKLCSGAGFLDFYQSRCGCSRRFLLLGKA